MAGHRAAARNLEHIITGAAERGIKYLTLFAFSTENWNRPEEEVKALMKLLLSSLKKETKKLHRNNIRLQIIGNKAGLSDELQEEIKRAEKLTENNQRMTVNLAINYGGTWDITQACQKVSELVEAGKINSWEVSQELIESHLSTAGQPAPDLMIRTSGENRVSNFLIWQTAYSEFYFTDTLWPDFDKAELDKAIGVFSKRERRFGKTSEQIQTAV